MEGFSLSSRYKLLFPINTLYFNFLIFISLIILDIDFIRLNNDLGTNSKSTGHLN